MNLKYLVGASIVAAASAANATTITLDAFTLTQTVVGAGAAVSSTLSNTNNSGLWSSRTLSITAPASTFNGLPALQVSGGALNLTSFSEAGSASVSWGFAESTVALFSNFANWSIAMQDNSPNQPGGGVEIRTTGSLRTFSGSPLTTVLASSALNNLSNPFKVDFTFASASDARYSLLKLDYTCKTGLVDNQAGGCAPSQVPAPATLAILGLGLLGLAGMRRKA